MTLVDSETERYLQTLFYISVMDWIGKILEDRLLLIPFQYLMKSKTLSKIYELSVAKRYRQKGKIQLRGIPHSINKYLNWCLEILISSNFPSSLNQMRLKLALKFLWLKILQHIIKIFVVDFLA